MGLTHRVPIGVVGCFCQPRRHLSRGPVEWRAGRDFARTNFCTSRVQTVEPGKGAGLLDGSLVVQEENLRWLIQKVGGPVLYT
jgi:hypothetical protein